MNPAYLLILHVLDLLTGGSLDYKQPHGAADSRIEAGLRLVEENAVRQADTPGAYIVAYSKGDKGLDPDVIARGGYYVSALWGDLSCECRDSKNAENNPIGLCKHQIAAVVVEAQQMVFAQMDAMERSAA
jgi:uncharacterized Zn finger protein